MVCPNQCSGRGECREGFCKCDDGWYGTDCARRRAGTGVPTSGLEAQRPWLQDLVRRPPALTAAQGAGGARGPASVRAGEGDKEGYESSGSGGAIGEDAAPPRRRPFVYVYDLPPAYNTRMLQYRVDK
eukprot:361620-Chlamydomonas_euryale.AAC.2